MQLSSMNSWQGSGGAGVGLLGLLVVCSLVVVIVVGAFDVVVIVVGAFDVVVIVVGIVIAVGVVFFSVVVVVGVVIWRGNKMIFQ